jgi:hypothetical protein
MTDKQQLTEGQSIAKDFWNEIRNSGHVASEREMAERIDAALTAARAGTGAEKPKEPRRVSVGDVFRCKDDEDLYLLANTDYKQVALIHLRSANRLIAPIAVRDLPSLTAVAWHNASNGQPDKYEYVGASSDLRFAAAAEQMREACAQTVELQRDCIPLNRDPLEVADMMRVDAARAIRAIPTEGAKP